MNKNRSEIRQPLFFGFSLIIFLLVLLATLVITQNTYFGISRLINWVLFMPIILLFKSVGSAEVFRKSLVLTALIQMAAVGLQYLGLLGGTWGGLITSGYGYDPINSTWAIRYSGFLEPNGLAMVCVIGCIAVVTSSAKNRFFNWILVVIFTCGVFLSGSRGGILCLAIATLSYLLLSRRFALVFLLTILLMVFSFGFTYFVDEHNVLLYSLKNIVDGQDSSSNSRLNLWSQVLQGGESLSSLFGSGFGGRNPEVFRNQRSLFTNAQSLTLATFDNSWLKIFVESGVVAVASLAIVLLAAILKGVKAFGGRYPNHQIAGTTILVIIIFRSFSFDCLDINPWNCILWMTIGLTLHGGGQQNPKVSSGEMQTDNPNPSLDLSRSEWTLKKN